MRQIEAVVFDIDGTLTPDNSWTALTRDLGASVVRHMNIFTAHIDGAIEYEESKHMLVDLWQETNNANRQFIDKMYASWPTHPEAAPLASWLKNNDYLVCLITSATFEYAEHIANKIEVDDYYASAKLHFDDDGNLFDFDYVLDQSSAKVRHLEQFCQKRGLRPDQCIAVGDSENDLGLFERTGNGYLIGDTDKEKLLKAAHQRIVSLSDIKKIVDHKST